MAQCFLIRPDAYDGLILGVIVAAIFEEVRRAFFCQGFLCLDFCLPAGTLRRIGVISACSWKLSLASALNALRPNIGTNVSSSYCHGMI